MPRPRLAHPLLRLALLALLPLLALLCWYLWSPGLDLRDGTHDVGHNGLWMQHGWFADDLWFKAGGANNREKRKAFFRDPATLARTAELLRQFHIGDVFPHLCPCNSDGTLPRVDHPQVERFLDAFSDFRVFPWVGGIRGDGGGTAFPEDPTWRRTFITSCNELLHRHPRFAGIHINIEPVPSGDRDFLTLLEELGAAIPADKLISVAAYPPPTRWHPFPNVHWEEAYSREVGQRANHIVVMMYDTSLHNEKLYRHLMDEWTTEVLAWYPRDEVLLGIPAYDESA
ncbi:MAG TPA: glycosyl hydrolase family 18 protein, partial [Phycisphaerae bacterium]|nr:glycosyl hydrolase family 18 protein [Phycisphaerae bacterium]